MQLHYIIIIITITNKLKQKYNVTVILTLYYLKQVLWIVVVKFKIPFLSFGFGL
jgi:hypothetical protein